MTKSTHPDLDEAFIARQHDRLVTLRLQLTESADATAVEGGEVRDAAGDEPGDGGDDGDRLEQLANEEALLARNEQRLADIGRALDKIREHTYGMSDGNGEPIARDHLEAVPEAIYTTEELRAREKHL
ncbi:TraR/DksA family transcriptional regulator [Pinirhizobacter sp.]|jgi:DnaK suppressor protein|uniref:TraR/DksA family transcriptional regulator n=1 Tax=Pinirhizobacter sp. TaxID=2950432 RepID=UPI002F401292